MPNHPFEDYPPKRQTIEFQRDLVWWKAVSLGRLIRDVWCRTEGEGQWQFVTTIRCGSNDIETIYRAIARQTQGLAN